jgi:hypothetical protein|tara:strand:- start:163 stop:408 length:246 start_codon:yes stop_codon:yes gene_type:complete
MTIYSYTLEEVEEIEATWEIALSNTEANYNQELDNMFNHIRTLEKLVVAQAVESGWADQDHQSNLDIVDGAMIRFNQEEVA